MKPSVFLIMMIVSGACFQAAATDKAAKIYEVVKVNDFEITGSGGAEAWTKAAWGEMKREGKDGLTYFSRFKAVYSATGLYFFMTGSDERL
ncbi:MAG: hypothetical protein NZ935_07795, partial [Planctomycetes bacterium]|nr:hypothetical protein [Planctomycetota bacterium]